VRSAVSRKLTNYHPSLLWAAAPDVGKVTACKPRHHCRYVNAGNAKGSTWSRRPVPRRPVHRCRLSCGGCGELPWVSRPHPSSWPPGPMTKPRQLSGQLQSMVAFHERKRSFPSITFPRPTVGSCCAPQSASPRRSWSPAPGRRRGGANATRDFFSSEGNSLWRWGNKRESANGSATHAPLSRPRRGSPAGHLTAPPFKVMLWTAMMAGAAAVCPRQNRRRQYVAEKGQSVLIGHASKLS
jgi:hypothetical protein